MSTGDNQNTGVRSGSINDTDNQRDSMWIANYEWRQRELNNALRRARVAENMLVFALWCAITVCIGVAIWRMSL